MTRNRKLTIDTTVAVVLIGLGLAIMHGHFHARINSAMAVTWGIGLMMVVCGAICYLVTLTIAHPTYVRALARLVILPVRPVLMRVMNR